MKGALMCAGLMLAILLAVATGSSRPQEQSAAPSNRLLTGKVAYVEPMPSDLDKWIAEDIKAWNRYRVTANPEGVDLVIRADAADKSTRYTLRHGVPQPKKGKDAPPVLSVVVTDWVTNQVLWRIDLESRKFKPDQPDPSNGEHTSLAALGLTSDQLAQKIVIKLRQYVTGLQTVPDSKP